MSDQGKDLSHAEADANIPINFTYEELIDELARELTPPRIQPGDIPERRLAERLGCSRDATRRQMEPKVKAGEWERVRVLDDDSHWVVAYRKKG